MGIMKITGRLWGDYGEIMGLYEAVGGILP
jgi:hypothetical protein